MPESSRRAISGGVAESTQTDMEPQTGPALRSCLHGAVQGSMLVLRALNNGMEGAIFTVAVMSS